MFRLRRRRDVLAGGRRRGTGREALTGVMLSWRGRAGVPGPGVPRGRLTWRGRAGVPGPGVPGGRLTWLAGVPGPGVPGGRLTWLAGVPGPGVPGECLAWLAGVPAGRLTRLAGLSRLARTKPAGPERRLALAVLTRG